MRGIAHGFEGDLAMLKDWLDIGFFVALGYDKWSSSPRHMEEVVKAIPTDRLIVESDANPMISPGGAAGRAFRPRTNRRHPATGPRRSGKCRYRQSQAALDIQGADPMEYEVLSPRADVDPIRQIGLNPRVADLNSATIGLYATFKEHWVLILDEIAKQIKERYPGATFARFQYTKDLNSYTQVAEVAKDPEVRPQFEEWVKGVDAVIVANADAGSCTLYLTYNATLPEHLGKPIVLTVAKEFVELLKRAAELRGVPTLR